MKAASPNLPTQGWFLLLMMFILVGKEDVQDKELQDLQIRLFSKKFRISE